MLTEDLVHMQLFPSLKLANQSSIGDSASKRTVRLDELDLLLKHCRHCNNAASIIADFCCPVLTSRLNRVSKVPSSDLFSIYSLVSPRSAVLHNDTSDLNTWILVP